MRLVMTDGKVTKIKRLQVGRKFYTVCFQDGFRVYISGVGYVSQQLAYPKLLMDISNRPYHFAGAIAKALGSGPENVNSIASMHGDRFMLSFFDFSVNRYDRIDYFNDGVAWVNNCSLTLAEQYAEGNVPSLQEWESQFKVGQIEESAIALVTDSSILSFP